MTLRLPLFSLAAVLSCAAAALHAQPSRIPPHAPGDTLSVSAVVPQRGEELTVYLLTAAHGADVWELFGHNALVFRDAVDGSETVVHWGLFDFGQPNFVPRFLQGRMLYSMGVFTFEETLASYRQLNRSVHLQHLNLTPAQRAELRDFVVWNARPENRDYRYDYFLDNCSTRIRDALDRALGGRMAEQFGAAPTGRSFRWHALRLTQRNPPLAVGIDLGLGRPADRPITVWEELFLPMRMRERLRDLTVVDDAGVARPLVLGEFTAFEGTRPAEPEREPMFAPWLIVLGLLGAALVTWFLRRAEAGAAWARTAASASLAAWSTLLGVLGLLVFLLWSATDHIFAHRNENLLIFNPLWLGLAVLLPLAVRRGAGEWTRRFALLAAGFTLLAPAMHLVFLSRQANLGLIGLTLPMAVVVGWYFGKRRESTQS